MLIFSPQENMKEEAKNQIETVEPSGFEEHCQNQVQENNNEDIEASKKKRKISWVILDQSIDDPNTDGWAEVFLLRLYLEISRTAKTYCIPITCIGTNSHSRISSSFFPATTIF